MHPVRAARVAIMHTWQNTQTEGWWRMAFDFNQVPFDYISIQDLAKNPDLNSQVRRDHLRPRRRRGPRGDRGDADVAQPDSVEE